MTGLLRRFRIARIARLLGLAATPFVFSTCELVNQPGAAGGDIAVTFAPGFTTMVVGREVTPTVGVTQGGNPVTDPRLVIVSSNPQIITVNGSSVRPIARGTAKLYVRLVTSTLGQNPPGDSITVQVIAAGVRTDAPSLTLRSINETATVGAHAIDNAGGDIPAPIIWSSSNPAVATVNDTTGVIKAISNGPADITATVDGRTATVAVTVNQRLARYEFSPTGILFASLGDTVTVVATPKDSGGTTIPPANAPLRTLQSTFPSVAGISPTGKVTAFANGFAGIEAKSGTVADTLDVEVRQVAELVVITGADSVLIEAIGDTTKLIALASDQLSGSVLNATPVWVSLDLGLAIVDPLSGVVRSLNVGGPARIVARLDNGADTVRVYVTNEPRVLDVTPTNVLITAVGDATQLAGTPRNRLGAILPTIPVTWSTTDASVATVNGTGLITATGEGTGRIVGQALGGVLADTAVVVVVNSPDAVDITSADSTLTSFDDTWVPAASIKNSRNATLARNAVTWVSDDPGIATVSPLGLVRAVSAGVVKIRATNPLNAARTDSVTVTVSNQPIAISLNRALDTLTAPTKTLTYVADSRNARGVQVEATAITWRSTNPAVATVGAGLATAVAPGTTNIISEVTGGSGVLADTSVLVVRNAPKTLSVSPTAAQLTFVGATQQLTPTVLNDLGNSIPGSVLAWSTSNPLVASVSGTGLVTALAVGTTIITVKVGNLLDTLSASTAIEVSNAPASIDITQTSVTLASINDVFPTTGTYLSGQGVSLPSTSATWTSDDPSVAEVTSAGVITARARGTTTVRATSPLNASITDALAVTVTNAPVSLALNRTSDNLSSLGRTLSYSATVLNAAGAQIPGELVTWTSSVPGVATLAAGNAQDNLATALTVGSTSIIAAVGSGLGLRADTAALNVANTAVSVAITPAPANISAVGGQLVLTATARNELGNVIPGAPASWASLNNPVATVTSPGPTTTVTGAGVGSVTITATVDGVTAQITVSVANDLVSMSIVPDTTLQSVNDTLLARVNFRNGVNDSLPEDVAVWTSTDINVASVSSNGTIVARGVGTAVIRAASPLNAGTFDELTVTVTNAPATISLTRNDTTLTAIGRTLEYGAQVRNARTDLIGGAVVTWTSTTPSVASVDPSSGLATALTVGTTNIRGTASNGIFAQKQLTVTNNAASVSVSPGSVTITSIGATASVSPTVRNDLGNPIAGATVTWAVVPGAGVVSVPVGATSGAQNITATGAGTATVTITASAGVTTSLPVTVRDDPTTVDFGTTTAVTLLNLRRTDDLFANPQTVIQNALNVDLPASSVNWTTTNASVATVSAAGVVTGVGAGTAIIAATSPVDPTKTDAVTYTVQAPAYSITLNQSTDSLTALTQSRIYTATVRDSLGNVLPGVGGSVAWTDANNAGPKVTFTPTTGFSTTATAAAVSGATRATLTANVTPTTALTGATLAASVDVGVGNDPASVSASPTSATITSVGGTASITPTVRNNLGGVIAGAQVTWATSNAGVVTVPLVATTGAQNITASGVGTAVVTMTAASGVETTVFVTVARVASAATSTITAFPTTIIANGVSTSTITVQLKDAGGGNLTTGGNAVTLAVQAPALGTTIGNAFDNNDGTYTATLNSGTTLGTVTVIGTVNTVAITDNATVDLIAGPATVLVATGSTSQTAGDAQTVTITAQDAQGNTAGSYGGDKSLTFSGALNSPSGQSPTATNKLAADIDFGAATIVTFTAGVGSSSIKLYRAETALIAVTDGSIAAAGANRLSVSVTAAALDNFAVSLTSPQTNGIAFTGTNTLTARDLYHNTVTTFDASADNVTIAANAPLAGVVTGNDAVLEQAGDFVNGVANLAGDLVYTGLAQTGTFTATSGVTNKSGSSNAVTINAGAATQLEITGLATQTAGTQQAITITAQDLSGNTAATYAGDKILTFTGAADALTGEDPTVEDKNDLEVDFGNPATITFAAGVATRDMRLFFAETALINVDDGTFGAAGNELAVTVTADDASTAQSTVAASPLTGVLADGVDASTVTVQLKDAFGNNTTTGVGSGVDATLSGSATNAAIGVFGTLGGGTYTASLTSTTFGDAIVNARINTTDITHGTNPRTVTFVASRLVLTGAGAQTAGTSQTVAITAQDADGNTVTSYTGDKVLTFGGASDALTGQDPTATDKDAIARAFGVLTTVAFTAGVASTDIVLYRAEAAVIDVTDQTISAAGGDRLSVTVTEDVLDNFGWSLTSPQTNAVAFTGTNTLTARDQFNNPVTTFDASADNVSVSVAPSGTVSGLDPGAADVLDQAGDFVNGVANLTALLTYTGVETSVTFTATSTVGTKTGTSGAVTIDP